MRIKLDRTCESILKDSREMCSYLTCCYNNNYLSALIGTTLSLLRQADMVEIVLGGIKILMFKLQLCH